MNYERCVNVEDMLMITSKYVVDQDLCVVTSCFIILCYQAGMLTK